MKDLEIVSLTKTYRTSAVVDGASFDLDKGEMIAILGPSGCGKTTTLRMVAGFVTPTGGRILLRGKDITMLPPNHRDMGMVFQSYALFPHMTVFDNIAFGLRAHGFPKAELPGRVKEFLELVGLGQLGKRYPRELSGGQQQRVAVARVLALRPQVLLFDEPLSNLDAKMRVQMRGEIRRLQKDSGISALFVTHDQEEAMVIADRIVVMNNGKIEQVGTPDEIYDRPRSTFVADFIGKTNLIGGRIQDGRFVTSSGLPLQVDLEEGLKANGASISVSIRPEKLTLAAPAPGGELVGRITRVTNLGSITETEIELASGDVLTAQEQCGSSFQPRIIGDEVAVRWRPGDARLLTR
ncbi:MAG: ABC transporter ATP-binding protein [Mesorhizobium sp.]|uniref:ABC transporter ATP-binding protein n=1 Tax=Mesorhizobium sp. TaxID=1871066 RepID=UPI000FEA0FD5|nr:ABC transporter ATP-binding protein [Mesorhizobium sp.]RWI50281.1 MAG: ABC transporter ATP-binding protein [Mesorhizobium sp.]